ncbi:hypothetical protein FSP39_025302 [Pinctada imbricata]|uniref:Endonuclease/exonuclease/phosphatase domain-containing protein n=1 Tax=Pinctada imbricata TaxID=66713 RepID=A0AA88Y3Y5_PINIB|nr:hypothetical protein FSP39_025302 [Pinctada imbricata]
MSENKLRKTLNKPPIPATVTKTHTPAVLTFKGKWLLKTLAHKSESTAKWWYKSGDTCKDGYKWLKSNFKSKVKKLGDIWLYVWLGTCDLTTKKAILNYTKPDIVIGIESCLKGIQPGKNPTKDAIKSSEIFTDQYQAFRNDRGTLGGGVFVLVHNSIVATEQPQYVTNCEINWVKIKLQHTKNLLIGSFYMPHRSKNTLEELEKSLQLVTNDKNNNIILAGDFNCPDISWNTLSLKSSSSDKEIQSMLINLTTQEGLTQVHDEATRGENLLDLIFTTNPSLVKTSSNIPGISVHAIIVTDVDAKPYYQKQNPRKAYQWSKANWEGVYTDLDNLTSEIESLDKQGTPINNLWNKFKNAIHSSLDKNIPAKMIKSNKLQWINHKIMKMIRRKQTLYNQAKRNGKWANYHHYQKECKRQIRNAEWQYINTAIIEGMDKNNSKPFWKYVKSRKQDNIGVTPLKFKSQLINDSKHKAKLLLDQFASVFTKEKASNMPSTTKKVKNSMNHIKIREEGVRKLLENINPSKATGPDNIPNRVLKQCAKQLAPALTCIYQRSLDSGELPKDWLSANISCIYKKGDKHAPENYRPVSLTSVPCKLLEHIICKNMMKHLEQNKVLTTLNHGIRSG